MKAHGRFAAHMGGNENAIRRFAVLCVRTFCQMAATTCDSLRDRDYEAAALDGHRAKLA